jgi:hypothetical protein
MAKTKTTASSPTSPTGGPDFRAATSNSKAKARGKGKGTGPIDLIPKVASRAVEKVKKEAKVVKGGKTKGGSGKKDNLYEKKKVAKPERRRL